MAYKSRYLANTQIAEVIDIARGAVIGTSSINKFGYNSAVGISYETVWDGNNLYTYISTAGTATVTSSNSASDDGGTVQVFGLNAAYEEVNETLTIGGSAGLVSFYRVFRAVLLTANTGTSNVGNITVTVDSKSAAIINAGYGQTLMALYTVPVNKNAYMLQLDAGSSKDLENELIVVTRNGDGGAFNTKEFLTFRGEFLEKDFKIPLLIPEKHDIEIRVKSSATSAISAAFELILIDD